MEVMLSMFAPALSEEGARFYIEQNGGRIELGIVDRFVFFSTTFIFFRCLHSL